MTTSTSEPIPYLWLAPKTKTASPLFHNISSPLLIRDHHYTLKEIYDINYNCLCYKQPKPSTSTKVKAISTSDFIRFQWSLYHCQIQIDEIELEGQAEKYFLHEAKSKASQLQLSNQLIAYTWYTFEILVGR